MRIGIISTRLNGTDGVSLEVEKWSRLLSQMGHDIFYCAGQLGGYAAGGTLIPLLFFQHPIIEALNEQAFGRRQAWGRDKLMAEIEVVADELRAPLQKFVQRHQIELLIIQNALAIPMNLPLGMALTRLIGQSKLPTIAHHHDFYWERPRYRSNAILSFLDDHFPPDLPSMRHATINSIAQQCLRIRRGIDSIVVSNVHDFATPPPGIDDYNQDLRTALGLKREELLILQPTRVIERKGIEMAIELLHLLNWPNSHLYISHSATDEGQAYWQWLKREASVMNVDLQLIEELVGTERETVKGIKRYSLWDVYPHADLVTYPSTYEGFGNALLEAIYFKKAIVVNRYPVYNADIGSLGFEFVELDNFVSQKAVQQVRQLLQDPQRVRHMTEKNYAIAQAHFSLEVLEQKLAQLLASF